ncbi:hypothetical protein [Streptomyces sp. NPDC056512]|uniref:hypothetical protein n=1 Tax=Streptomyces sp. NPDC056512 TaxID=3345846 RepID=UPI0036CCB344
MEHERTSADVAQRQRSLRFSKLPEPIRLKDTVEERQRSLRFSKLPEPIRLKDTVEERPAVAHDSVSGAYNPDRWLIRMGGL